MTMVDEMQWTGGNVAEMRAWAGGVFLEPRYGRPAAVCTCNADGGYGWVYLQVGDYAVRHEPDPVWVDIGGDGLMKRGPVYTARCA